MSPIKLIVNADDFGLTKGVNLGIIESYRNGIVRSTTIMANQCAVEHAAALAEENKGLGIGIHLTLTAGRPLVDGLKSLVDENGTFLKQGALAAGNPDQNEIEAEFDAQIKKVMALGIKITHLDSHHHVHLNENVLPVVCGLAKKYDLPVRAAKGVKSTDSFSMKFYGDFVTLDGLKEILSEKAVSLEVMAHPAYLDYELYKLTSYGLKRIDELYILTSDEIKNFIKESGIELCNFLAI